MYVSRTAEVHGDDSSYGPNANRPSAGVLMLLLMVVNVCVLV